MRPAASYHPRWIDSRVLSGFRGSRESVRHNQPWRCRRVNNTFCVNGCGSVFKLAPKGDATYTESVIHSFPGTKGNTDGRNPVGGLFFDSADNLWGSTQARGNGTVFELTPNSDGTYTESTLFMFTGASTGFDRESL
jgi:hypothetical protein